MRSFYKIAFLLYIFITVLGLIPPAISHPSTTTITTTTTSVMDFGAVGNDSTDDTHAVQSAINSSFTRVKFPAGGTYHIKTLQVPAGMELAVEEGAMIFWSNELKGRNAACWRVVMAAGGGGVVVSGGGRISGTTLITVKKGGDKEVNVRWEHVSWVCKMRIWPHNICIICDHSFSCNPPHPGHW